MSSGWESPRRPVPEAQALNAALRRMDLGGAAFSVFAVITTKGIPAIQVVCDLPNKSKYFIYYKPEVATDRLAKNAQTRILAQIANV